MNLIDVDRYEKGRKPKGISDENWNSCEEAKAIHQESKVEAIPIEWLERNYANNGLYCTEKYKKRAKIVKEIIEDWRARNAVSG